MPRRNIPRAASWPARALLSGLLIAALGAAQPTLLAWGAAPTGGHGVAPALGGAATILGVAIIVLRRPRVIAPTTKAGL